MNSTFAFILAWICYLLSGSVWQLTKVLITRHIYLFCRNAAAIACCARTFVTHDNDNR